MPAQRGVNSLDPPVGLVRNGTIVGYDPTTNTLQVRLTEATAAGGLPPTIPVPAYFPHSDSNGAFIGAMPSKGTTVTLSQTAGGQYYIVNQQQENLSMIPDLQNGQMLLHTTDTSHISLDMDSHIHLGSDTNNIHIFAGSDQYPKSNLITLNFENENHFNQSFREVAGLVKRDLRPNPIASSYDGSTKLEDDMYDSIYSIIGMDPTATANDLTTGSTKNPPFAEHRQMVYEFQFQSDIDDDVSESNKYSSTSSQPTTYTTPNRRMSRADTMSLSLVSPNYLIEIVNGTVVDIFGNILDLNRGGIPIGLAANNTLRASGTTATSNAQQSWITIRALERKSIAHHFEINARKDPMPPWSQGMVLDLSINADNYNAKSQRMRFFTDVDKEGQLKMNVPGSSEEGNVPLLVIAENYSTFATTDNNNPNQTWFTQSPTNTGQDIYVDSLAAPAQNISSSGVPVFTQSFAHGSIQLVDGTSGADQGPVDRISQFVTMSQYNIKHGTAYHDVLQTGYMFRYPSTTGQSNLGWPTGAVNNVDVSYIASDMPTQAAVATNKITVSGTGANAGGRSGSVNLGGSLDINIGANTIDRQSVWLDTGGGIVANIGRDMQQRSLVMGMDGHAFIQIGGYGVQVSDARFSKQMDGVAMNGILDIRVYNQGFTHMIRVDQQGIVIMTPGRMGIHAGQGLTLSSDGDMVIDCETLTVQQRAVKKVFGGSI